MPAAQVLDSHAILKLLRGEAGAKTTAQILEKALPTPSIVRMTAVNYAEVSTCF